MGKENCNNFESQTLNEHYLQDGTRTSGFDRIKIMDGGRVRSLSILQSLVTTLHVL